MIRMLQRSSLTPLVRLALQSLRRVTALGGAGVVAAAELLGLAVALLGVWMVWPPLSLMVGGMLLVFLAQGVRHEPDR